MTDKKKTKLKRKINKLLDEVPDAIETVDENLMMGVVGVSQAIGQLKQALKKVDKCLNKRQFSKASHLGYKDVASEFIFLQRTLGDLQGLQHDKDKLIQDIAMKAETSYETIQPLLDERLKSAKPRDPNAPRLTKKELKAKFQELLKSTR